MSSFTAKYPGVCAKCGESIEVGDPITWARTGKNAKRYYHDRPHCKNGSYLSREHVKERRRELGLSKSRDEEPEPAEPKQTTIEPDREPEPKKEPAKDGGLGAVLAEAVKPHLAAKVDRAEVEEIIREELAGRDRIERTIQTHRVEIETPEGVRELERTHRDFAAVLELVQAGRGEPGWSVYLTGRPGGGKSTIAKQAAQALGLDFYLLTLAPMSPPSGLVGYGNADGEYVESDAYKAYTRGGLLMVEEIDNANDGVLTSFNAALANGHGSWPVVGTVERHPDFVLMAAGNTAGLGPTSSFPSRRKLDAAFRDRFVFHDLEYDPDLEMALALEANDGAAPWVDWCRQLREWADANAPGLFVTPRSVIFGARLLAIGRTAEQAADAAIFRGCGQDVRGRALEAHAAPEVV